MSYKVREEKKRSLEPPLSPTTSIPDDVILDIVARVRRCYYPAISLVSKSFRKLVASPELYTRRSLLGCTEHCLYVVLYNRHTHENRLCILCPTFNSNRLVISQSLPLMPYYARYVAVGSKIYVFCELDAFSIDCRSHTVQPISDIPNPQPMSSDVVDFIDGKIYVIGYCFCDDEVSGKLWRKRVKVYNTETQMWEPGMTKQTHMELGNVLSDVVVMENKIYMKNSKKKSFVYEPKENKGKLDEMLSSKDWKDACAVDNVLYYYDIVENVLRAYDPNQKCWTVVKGLEKLSPKTNGSLSSKTVGYGGKLGIFFYEHLNAMKEKIWCAEIALERCQGGEIWGKVQWSDVVIDDGSFEVVKCLAVNV